MRIVGVAMVRNEADIVESFVRHNLTQVDALTVIDHGSVDGTGEILAALVAEGLPLTVERDTSLAQRQPEVLTRAARAAFAADADIVVPLDADEFLRVSTRPAFERLMGGLPDDADGLLAWQTYVPDLASPAAPTGAPRAIAGRRLAIERQGLGKVALGRGFRDAAAAVLGPGSHAVLRSGANQDPRVQPIHLARIPAGIAALAHVPVRSGAQILAKTNVGWLAHRAARRANPDLAFHWRELAEEFARTGMPSPARVADIAANYGVPMSAWQPAAAIATIDDPLPAIAPLRYTHLARTDAAMRIEGQRRALESELAQQRVDP